MLAVVAVACTLVHLALAVLVVAEAEVPYK
jgi:hypothetical protein